MRKLAAAFLFLIMYSAVSNAQTRRSTRAIPCKLSNLYLDVSVAIDFSSNMGTDGILKAVTDVASVFTPTNILQSGSGPFSRVAVSKYTNTSQIVFNLGYFNSTAQLTSQIYNIVPTTTTDPHGFVYNGLLDSYSVLSGAGNSRRNAPKTIILYLSEFSSNQQDAINLANTLKSMGISIIVVDNSPKQNVQNLNMIASPGMVFVANDAQLIQKIQNALCATNAYCPQGSKQVADSYANPTKMYGECLSYITTPQLRTDAANDCESRDTYLVNIFDQFKSDFVYDMAVDVSKTAKPQYFIGLWGEPVLKKWVWDQTNENNPLPLQSVDYNAWSPPGTPVADELIQTNVAVLAKTNGWNTTHTKFKTAYACQLSTCDTVNFCA